MMKDEPESGSSLSVDKRCFNTKYKNPLGKQEKKQTQTILRPLLPRSLFSMSSAYLSHPHPNPYPHLSLLPPPQNNPVIPKNPLTPTRVKSNPRWAERSIFPTPPPAARSYPTHPCIQTGNPGLKKPPKPEVHTCFWLGVGGRVGPEPAPKSHKAEASLGGYPRETTPTHQASIKAHSYSRAGQEQPILNRFPGWERVEKMLGMRRRAERGGSGVWIKNFIFSLLIHHPDWYHYAFNQS